MNALDRRLGDVRYYTIFQYIYVYLLIDTIIQKDYFSMR